MHVSHTKLSIAKACWKKFEFQYVHKLKPLARNKNLTLGRIVHDAFEMYYQGVSKDDILHHINKTYQDEMSKSELTDQEALIIERATAIGMWMGNPFINERYDHIEVEMQKVIPFIAKTNLVYKTDAKVKINDHTWIIERKITMLNQRKFDGFCRTSSQATNYVLGELMSGTPVDGVIFECIRKPLLRKGMRETASEFARRITKDYGLRPRFYYERKFSYRNREEIELFVEDTEILIKEMKRRIRTKQFNRNTDHCWAFGSECPYMKICFVKKPDPLLMELYFKKGGDDSEREERNRNESKRREAGKAEGGAHAEGCSGRSD